MIRLTSKRIRDHRWRVDLQSLLSLVVEGEEDCWGRGPVAGKGNGVIRITEQVEYKEGWTIGMESRREGLLTLTKRAIGSERRTPKFSTVASGRVVGECEGLLLGASGACAGRLRAAGGLPFTHENPGAEYTQDSMAV